MQSIHEIASDIVAREGGFVNDPDDPGGATKYGVTIHTMRRLGLDLDGDGDVDVSGVRKLSRDRATQIFIGHYFHRSKIAQLPQGLQAPVFDMNVNAGANSVKILQRLVRRLGFRIGVDGQIGPQTISAVRQATQSAPDHIGDAYGIERRNYYYALGDRRKHSRKYARRQDGGKGGWIVRAEEFIVSKYHLTDAEHRARVASWG